MRDIVLCRTPALGGSVYACDDCGALDYAYHSCRNRHCPKCQADRAKAWLHKVRARLLPCDHYLLTFTLPEPLRVIARSHQNEVYGLLLREAAAAVQALAEDPTWLGARPGILAVLHTWSRTLAYHPHAHLLVTAGGLAPDGRAWVTPAHARFLIPGYALSEIFRAKIRDGLQRAGLGDPIDLRVWSTPWTVHVQQIGSGQNAVLYLSRYIYRVALANDRIEDFQDGRVTFRYTDARTGQTRRMTLPVQDFIARFLQHVLPARFAKVRYYGLLSPAAAQDLEKARQLLQPADESDQHAAQTAIDAKAGAASPAPAILPRRCTVCSRGHMHFSEISRRTRAPP